MSILCCLELLLYFCAQEKERLELSLLSAQKQLVKLEEKKAVDEVGSWHRRSHSVLLTHILTLTPSHPHISSHTFTQVVIRQLMAQVEQLRAERIPECERSQREMKTE